jgi:hypothetical protein
MIAPRRRAPRHSRSPAVTALEAAAARARCYSSGPCIACFAPTSRFVPPRSLSPAAPVRRRAKVTMSGRVARRAAAAVPAQALARPRA